MAELGFGINGSSLARTLAAEENLHAGLMTDTLGEARMAACLSGLWGFKPTWGLLSRYGLTGLVPSMECTGILAKHPADIAKMMAAMAGPDERDGAMCMDPPPDFSIPLNAHDTDGKPFCIGIPKNIPEFAETPLASAFSAARDAMAGAGFTIKEIEFPDLRLFSSAHQVIAAVEASSSAGRYDGVRYGRREDIDGNWNDMYLAFRGAAFGPLIKTFLMQGAYFQFQDYAAFEDACILRRNLLNETSALFKQVDYLALPTQAGNTDPVSADTVPDTYAAFRLTLAPSLTGQPALHIPNLATSAENRPHDFGIQLIGPRMGDVGVLAAGQALFHHIQGVFPS
jgi:aspartyl-tRNA(Asn)/glutamyl-tRNA(Gln) amidotransferase subunit A